MLNHPRLPQCPGKFRPPMSERTFRVDIIDGDEENSIIHRDYSIITRRLIAHDMFALLEAIQRSLALASAHVRE